MVNEFDEGGLLPGLECGDVGEFGEMEWFVHDLGDDCRIVDLWLCGDRCSCILRRHGDWVDRRGSWNRICRGGGWDVMRDWGGI